MTSSSNERRRYIPLGERPWDAYPDPRRPLLVDGVPGRLLGCERAYLVGLENGRSVLLSQAQYDEALTRGGGRVVRGTVVRELANTEGDSSDGMGNR